jgi:peptidyl-prolyl cis-trans isomerase C
MERSTDAATRFNGGDLGYVTADVMPETYSGALKDAKIGAIVGPFKTDAGFVLLKVEDQRLEKPITLEDAKPQIVRFLSYDEVRDLLEKLRAKSQVKVLIGPAQSGATGPREPASAPAAAPGAASVGPSVAERTLQAPSAQPIPVPSSAKAEKTKP